MNLYGAMTMTDDVNHVAIQTQLLANKQRKRSEPLNIYVEEKRSSGGSSQTVKYRLGKFLGKGGFATVYEITELKTEKMLAAKIIDKQKCKKPKTIQKLQMEVQLHVKMNHPNIVHFQHYFEDHHNIYFLLEKCNNLTLMELIHRRTRLTESEARYYFAQIISAVKYCHKNHVIHRDLKLGNLFLHNMKIKLGDFGLATIVEQEGQKKTTICGTPNFIAPEVLNSVKVGGYSYEIDIWSMGVILYTLLIGKPPFETQNLETTYCKIVRNQYRFPSNSNISDHAKDFIGQMLQTNPQKRIPLEIMKDHDWFTQHNTPESLPMSSLTDSPFIGSPQIKIQPLENQKQSKKVLQIGNSENQQNGAIPIEIKCKKQSINRGSLAARQPFSDLNPKLSPHNSPFKVKKNSPFQISELEVEERNQSNQLQNIQNNNNINKISNTVENSENLNQDSLAKPQIWITKWINLERWGLGYFLSNGTLGILFNDSSKMLLSPNKSDFVYIYYEHSQKDCPSREKKIFGQILTEHGNYSHDISKKLTLLIHYGKFLNFELRSTKKSEEVFHDITDLDLGVQPTLELDFVKKFMIVENEYVVFRFNSGIVQSNFFDNTKLILSSEVKVITFINALNEHYTSELSNIKSQSIMKRLLYTKKGLASMISMEAQKRQKKKQQMKSVQKENIKH